VTTNCTLVHHDAHHDAFIFCNEERLETYTSWADFDQKPHLPMASCQGLSIAGLPFWREAGLEQRSKPLSMPLASTALILHIGRHGAVEAATNNAARPETPNCTIPLNGWLVLMSPILIKEKVSLRSSPPPTGAPQGGKGGCVVGSSGNNGYERRID